MSSIENPENLLSGECDSSKCHLFTINERLDIVKYVPKNGKQKGGFENGCKIPYWEISCFRRWFS